MTIKSQPAQPHKLDLTWPPPAQIAAMARIRPNLQPACRHVEQGYKQVPGAHADTIFWEFYSYSPLRAIAQDPDHDQFTRYYRLNSNENLEEVLAKVNRQTQAEGRTHFELYYGGAHPAVRSGEILPTTLAYRGPVMNILGQPWHIHGGST